MPTPFHMRRHQVFLSHASADKPEFVDALHKWMSEVAGISVWYDRELYGAAATKIAEGFDDSQAALFVVSKSSAESQWVEREFNCAMSEIESCKHFRVTSVRLDETRPPNFLKTYSHIDARGGELAPKSAALLLEALFGTADATGGRPVYFSRGTRRADEPANSVVEEVVLNLGGRLVCDAPDQAHSDPERLRRLIRSCGGLVAVLPLRAEGGTSPYVVSEIRLALAAGKPALVFAQPGVPKQEDWEFDVLPLTAEMVERGREAIEDVYDEKVAQFAGALAPSDVGQHVFIGHSFSESAKELFVPAQRLVCRLVGLPVKVGAWLTGRGAQQKIVEHIRAAEFCLVDITNSGQAELPKKMDYGLNSCIEAGVAIGAERPLFITCRGSRRTPPYMFRDREVLYYENEMELLGLVRRMCYDYRRQVIR